MFVIAWGVVQHGLLFPGSELRIELLRDTMVLPYFQMYIEPYLDVIQSPPYNMGEENRCTEDPALYLNYTKVRCADKETHWIVLILLMGFMLLTNLLLFNLLIAIFSQTFEEIEGNLTLYQYQC